MNSNHYVKAVRIETDDHENLICLEYTFKVYLISWINQILITI
jgi:hypothetical protein